MKNLPILVCLACVALSVSLNMLPEEEERYRDNMKQLNKLADHGSLEKMRELLGSEDFDRLFRDLQPVFGGSSDPDNQVGEDLIDPDFSVPVLGGEDDPDYSSPILGGEDDPDHFRPILGGEDDPDHFRPILGGEDDPGQFRPILGGEDDPDHSRPILGGEDDPDHFRPILGGDDDPDHEIHTNFPTTESYVTEGYSRPMEGGTDAPDQLKPILGGDDDPDHSRLMPGGETDPDHEIIFGGQSDPDQDTRITADSERSEMAEYPGKFERKAPKSGQFKPIRGKSPVKQQNKKGSAETDIPVDVDPCQPSGLPHPTSHVELCQTAECPLYQDVEIEGVCGFELRRYNKGVWVMTEMNVKKGITEAYKEASEKLMAFMNGENDRNVIMAATIPKTVVYIMKDMSTPKTAYLSQFLPVSYHETPPQPAEGKPLILKHNPEMHYYVRSFGGKPSVDQYRREFGMLAAAIKKSGLNAVWYMRFFHEYSNPWDEAQRHEVAVMVAPSES